VFARETLAETIWLGVDDEIYVALSVQSHVLTAMLCRGWKAEALEQRTQQLRIFGCVLDEFETVGAERVVTFLQRRGGATHVAAPCRVAADAGIRANSYS
jgi:hypothetical protein